MGFRNLNEYLPMESAVHLYVNYINHIIINTSMRKFKDLSIFYSYKIPAFSIYYFCKIIAKRTYCSPSTYIYAVCLLDRLIKKRTIIVNKFTVHKLTLTVLLLANKMLEDNIYNNKVWADIGNVNLFCINIYESFILKELDYRLHVTLEEYEDKLSKLSKLSKLRHNIYL